MNFLRLAGELREKEDAIGFLQDHGLLHRERYCSNGHQMVLKISEREDRWRCNIRGCREQRQLKSGTWLQGSHLDYKTVILFIYAWSREYTSIQFCKHELSIKNDHTVVDWNMYLREVCAQSLLANPIRIRGPNRTVEIDESLMVRRKFNRGRYREQQWVFGGICRETKECFLYAVPDRSEATLSSVILDTILPGSTIVSDMWRAYNGIVNLPHQNYSHLQVNHTENFVNPETGACTNTVESMWNAAKMKNKRRWGVHRSMVDSYLCEYMWRKRNDRSDLFDRIMLDIALYNPLV